METEDAEDVDAIADLKFWRRCNLMQRSVVEYDALLKHGRALVEDAGCCLRWTRRISSAILAICNSGRYEGCALPQPHWPDETQGFLASLP